MSEKVEGGVIFRNGVRTRTATTAIPSLADERDYSILSFACFSFVKKIFFMYIHQNSKIYTTPKIVLKVSLSS